jgi:SAM-dependent methyltransferase
MGTDEPVTIKTIKRPLCPCCDGVAESLHNGLKDRIFGAPGSWNLSRCSNDACGLAWLSPLPTQADISKAYVDYYTHTPDEPRSPAQGTSIFKTFQKGYAKLLGCAAERAGLENYFLDSESPGTVLEVGCGNGARLKRLADLGWEVEGQEVDPATLALAQSLGLNVRIGSIDDDYFSEKRYDRLVSNHVLEHVHDPAAVLKRCRHLLNESGKIVIATPNIRSFGHRLFGRNWRGLEPPRHLHIFSSSSLHQLLLDCGYRDVSVSSSSARADLILTGSVDLALRGDHTPSHSRPSILNAVLTVGLWTVARIYGLVFKDSGEELIAIARK